MIKRYSFEKLFEGNKLVLFCIIYTISIVIATISSHVANAPFYLTLDGMVASFLYLSAPILPLSLCQHLFQLKYIDEKSYHFWVGIPVHFVVSSVLLMFIVFMLGILRQANFGIAAYLSILGNYAITYIIIMAGGIVIDLIQTANVNNNLKKIRRSEMGKSQ